MLMLTLTLTFYLIVADYKMKGPRSELIIGASVAVELNQDVAQDFAAHRRRLHPGDGQHEDLLPWVREREAISPGWQH